MEQYVGVNALADALFRITNLHYRYVVPVLPVPEMRNPALLSLLVLYRQLDPRHHERQP